MKQIEILGKSFKISGHPGDPYFENADLASLESFFSTAKRFVTKRDVAIDIGSNVGFTTLALSILARKVYAFEPSSICHWHLCRTIEWNNISNVVAINAAISDSVGTVDFHHSVTSSASHVIGENHPAKAETPTQPIGTTTLDQLASENAEIGEASFVKIDVEGFEPRVIAGGGTVP